MKIIAFSFTLVLIGCIYSIVYVENKRNVTYKICYEQGFQAALIGEKEWQTPYSPRTDKGVMWYQGFQAGKKNDQK